MSKFVEECRREWKRLGVPDAVANEMAADLTADLAEAEAEGASIEDVLGSSALHPRSFADSWASERGFSLPPTQPAQPARSRRRWLLLMELAAVAVVLVGVLMLLAPKPHLHSETSGHGFALLPHPVPPPGLTARATTVASQVHTLGLLVLIVGIVASVATTLWIWRTRAPGGAGWSSPSAA